MPSGEVGSAEMQSPEPGGMPSYLKSTSAMRSRFSVPDMSRVSGSSTRVSSSRSSRQHERDRASIDSIHHRNCPLPTDTRVSMLGLGSSVVHHRDDWDSSALQPQSHVKSQKEKDQSILSYTPSIHLREQVFRGNIQSFYGTHDNGDGNGPAVKWEESHHIGQGAVFVNPIRHPLRRIYFSDPERHELNPDAGAVVFEGEVRCQPPRTSAGHQGVDSAARHELGSQPLGGLGQGADYNFRSTVSQLSEACGETSVREAMPIATLLNQLYGSRLLQRVPRPLRQKYTLDNLVSVQADALLTVYLRKLRAYHRNIMNVRRENQVELPEEQSNTLEIDDARDNGTFLGLEALQPASHDGRIATVGGRVFDSKSRTHGKQSEEECVRPEHMLRPHVVAEDAQISNLARMGIHQLPDGRRSWQDSVFQNQCDSEQDHSLRRWFSTVGSKEDGRTGKLVPARAFLYSNGVYSVWPLIPSDKQGALRKEHGQYVRRLREVYTHIDDSLLRQPAQVALRALVRSGTLIQSQQDIPNANSPRKRQRSKLQRKRYSNMLRLLRTLHAREKGWDTRSIVDLTPPFVLKQSLLHSATSDSKQYSDTSVPLQDNFRLAMGIHEPDQLDYLQSDSISELLRQLEGKENDSQNTLPKSIRTLLDLHDHRYDLQRSLQYRTPAYEFAHTRRDHRIWLEESLRALNESPLPRTDADREQFQRKKNKLLRGIKTACEEAERDIALQFKQRASIYDANVVYDRTHQEKQPETIYKYRGSVPAGAAEAAKQRLPQERGLGEQLMDRPVHNERLQAVHTLKTTRAAALEEALPQTVDDLYRISWMPSAQASAQAFNHPLVARSSQIHDNKLPLVVPLPVSMGLEVEETVVIPQHRVPRIQRHDSNTSGGSSGRDMSASMHGSSNPSTNGHHHMQQTNDIHNHRTADGSNTSSHSSLSAQSNSGQLRQGGWRGLDLISSKTKLDSDSSNSLNSTRQRAGRTPATAATSSKQPARRTKVDLLRQRQGWLKTTHITPPRNEAASAGDADSAVYIDAGSFIARPGGNETVHARRIRELRPEYLEEQIRILQCKLYELKKRTEYYSDPVNIQSGKSVAAIQEDLEKERLGLVLQLEKLEGTHRQFYQKQTTTAPIQLESEYAQMYDYKGKHVLDYGQLQPSGKQKKTYMNYKSADELNIGYGTQRLGQFQGVYGGNGKLALTKTRRHTKSVAEQRRSDKTAKLQLQRQETNGDYIHTQKQRDILYSGLGDAYDYTIQNANAPSTPTSSTKKQKQPVNIASTNHAMIKDDMDYKQIERETHPEYVRLPTVERKLSKTQRTAKMSQSEALLRSVPPVYYHEKYSNTPPKTKHSNELYLLSKEEAALQDQWSEHDRAVARSQHIMQ